VSTRPGDDDSLFDALTSEEDEVTPDVTPDREADLAVIEAGSRTLRAGGPAPQDDGVPARPKDPEVDKALRAVEAELADRWGETKLEPSLVRMTALMDILGDPQRAYPSIHITGTNGKTSTARMIEQLLLGFELRTGRYTSPHVQSVTERISLDGAPIPPEKFIETYTDLKPYVEMVDGQQQHRMSFFEVLTGMAYAAFADAPVDVAVVEVGMGGSWDATNVVDGSVAVVTPIALDHTDRLGETPGEIAVEKAGIVKKDATVVLAQQPVEAAQVLLKRAVEVDATVAREGMEFGVTHRELAVGGQLLTLRGLGGEYEQVFLPLHGEHQAHNAAVALAAVEAFFGIGTSHARTLDIDTIRTAFAQVTSPGRLEIVRRSPTVVLDAAHNPAGARAAAAAVADSFDFTRGGRAERGQGRTRGPGGLRAGLRGGRGDPELDLPGDGRGRAGGDRRRGLRRRPGAGRAASGRRAGGRDHPGGGRGRVLRRGRAGHRLGDHGGRGPAAAGPEAIGERRPCGPCARAL
jgi:dihydrofolate synthase/folylpolyglutamate synthase